MNECELKAKRIKGLNQVNNISDNIMHISKHKYFEG